MYSMLMQIQVLLTASLVAPPVYGDVCMSVSTGANPGDAPGAPPQPWSNTGPVSQPQLEVWLAGNVHSQSLKV